MSPSDSEQQSFSPVQGKAPISNEKMLKGCLYRLVKSIGLVIAFLLLMYILMDKYDRGSKAFEKGWWESAISLLEYVEPDDEFYEEAQAKLKIAREKFKQQQEKKEP